MKYNFKKAVAISLAATMVCSCFSGCKKKDDNVATSETPPVTTPTINQTDTPSVEHNITGDVDTSGGSQTINGKPVLTKLVVGTPNNCNQNGYMEATSIDGEYCYKLKEKATKYKNPVPFESSDGSNTILSTGHTVYVRKLYDDTETSNTEDSSSSEVGTVNDNGEQYIITDEHVEYSSGYYDENGNYVETTSETNKDSSSPLIAENLQKCIISGMEIFDIDNLSNEIEYPSDKTEYLSVKYSFPMWLCEKWIDEFGYDFTEKLIESFGMEKRLNIRPNRLKITADELCNKFNDNGINAEVYDGYIVSDGFDISADSLYNDGYYTIQDSAAMQTAKVLAPCEGDTVIDMCAAPGGKTTHIAELMNNKGKIYAFDVHEHKIELIKKNAERLGITIIEPKLSDGCKIDESMINTADKILCDVPCSGLGIIGRKPEIKWNRAEDNDLPKMQRQILDNASKYLKINGEIVYSTCTIEKEENEAVTDSFTADNENFKKVFEKTFYPHIDNTDGFYICKMKRIK